MPKTFDTLMSADKSATQYTVQLSRRQRAMVCIALDTVSAQYQDPAYSALAERIRWQDADESPDVPEICCSETCGCQCRDTVEPTD
jgi:hypothetical protein